MSKFSPKKISKKNSKKSIVKGRNIAIKNRPQTIKKCLQKFRLKSPKKLKNSVKKRSKYFKKKIDLKMCKNFTKFRRKKIEKNNEQNFQLKSK